ncbi:hypothetical protein D3C87_1917550 [compost metagenome]
MIRRQSFFGGTTLSGEALSREILVNSTMGNDFQSESLICKKKGKENGKLHGFRIPKKSDCVKAKAIGLPWSFTGFLSEIKDLMTEPFML